MSKMAMVATQASRLLQERRIKLQTALSKNSGKLQAAMNRIPSCVFGAKFGRYHIMHVFPEISGYDIFSRVVHGT